MDPFRRNERGLRGYSRSRKERVGHDHERRIYEKDLAYNALRRGSGFVLQNQKKTHEGEGEQQFISGLKPSLVP
jgi:hypothetical protein